MSCKVQSVEISAVKDILMPSFEGCRPVFSRLCTTHRSSPGSYCCLCKRSSCRSERLCLPLHLAAEITDTYSPSLYISLLLAQIDNINHSFLCALWLCSSHEQHRVLHERRVPNAITPPSSSRCVGVVGSPSSSQEFRSNDDQPVRMPNKLVGAIPGPFSNVSSARTSSGRGCPASDIRTCWNINHLKLHESVMSHFSPTGYEPGLRSGVVSA
jgi:hypothetical protein